MWADGDCWIIGGGTSMPRQFGISDFVIQDVNSQKDPMTVYSDYLKPLHDKNVVAANIAFLLGDWISVLYFCDSSFWRNYKKEMLAFHNLKVTCVNHLPRNLMPLTRNIKRMKRDMRPGLSGKANMICWNHNSGGAAIDFAAHTGVKRILLLGFDMKPHADDERRTHWHAGYANYAKPTLKNSFRRFLQSFPQIARDAKRRRIEILNVSPDSAIPDFPKVQLRDVL